MNSWKGKSLTLHLKHLVCFENSLRENVVWYGLAIRGLARYSVHTTATWDQFSNIIKKVGSHSDGMFLVFPWLIESRSYKKNQVWNITHYASHTTHHILHRNLEVLQNISDQHSGDLQQFTKTVPEDFWQIFFDGNHHIDNTNTYVRSKICQTNHFTVKQGTFWKVRFSQKIFKK